MKTYGKIPACWMPKACSDLARLGRDFDGGYLVCKRDVLNSDLLISLGISDDWSFEKDFRRLSNANVVGYDASIGRLIFLRRVFTRGLNLFRPKRFLRELANFFGFCLFFGQNGVFHVKKFVGFDSFGSGFEDRQYVGLQSVFEKFSSQHIFLKIDVEGSEYRFLDTLISNSDRIVGLVIEFHDCDLHMLRISDFVARFELTLVHLHANNYAPLAGPSGVPSVLEFTFTSAVDPVGNPILPNALDMPNNRFAEEISLVLENSHSCNPTE